MNNSDVPIQFIAEIGSNWLGSLQRALDHIEAAAQAGATGVKFQLFKAGSLYLYPPPPHLKQFELPPKLIPTLIAAAHKFGMTFSITPFSPDLAECLAEYEIDAVKVSAYDLTYDDLVWEAARLGVPIVLSTAMSTMKEIEHAVLVVERAGSGVPITLLHGTAAYPASLQDANLSALTSMRAWSETHLFPLPTLGLSDHTRSIDTAIAAVALGATHIEKHFVFKDAGWEQSPDAEHSASLPVFRSMVERCGIMQAALGTGCKDGPLPVEQALFDTCRRTNEKPLRTV